MTAIKKIHVKSILTKSNLPVCDFSVNPYVGCTHACRYCYAGFMKKFTNHLEDWGAFLDVKLWDKIKNPQRYAGKSIFMSSVTDPYNPQEEIFGRTRAFLEEFRGVDVHLSIQTKYDLVLRVVELIKTFPNVRVGFSINTLDEDFKRDMDNAASIARRLAAMKILHEAGIVTTCFISPIFPGITDVKAIIAAVKDQCNLIWLENLNLRGNFKPAILSYVAKKYPQLSSLYVEIYRRNDQQYWQDLSVELEAYAAEIGLEYRVNDDSAKKSAASPPTIVNFFHHEQIKKFATKTKLSHDTTAQSPR